MPPHTLKGRIVIVGLWIVDILLSRCSTGIIVEGLFNEDLSLVVFHLDKHRVPGETCELQSGGSWVLWKATKH